MSELPAASPIARGRAADVFALGDDRVLRRLRRGVIDGSEVAAMEVAENGGFPVPHLFAWSGADMELERLDGRDMLAVLTRSPWRLRREAHRLADLHLRLREVPVPAERRADLAPRFGGGHTLVHGDLHPGNVMMTSNGPVVIDWANAGVGPTDADVALTWMLLAIGDPADRSRLQRRLLGWFRRAFVRAFLQRAGRPSARSVAAVAAHRSSDPNFSAAEVEAVERFRRAHGE